MKKLPLILGLLAVAGIVASAALYLRAARARQFHAEQLAQAHARVAALELKAVGLTTQNTALQTQVSELDTSLGETKTRLTVTEARNVQLTRDAAEAKRELLARTAQADAAQREIASLQRDLAAARASVAVASPAPAPVSVPAALPTAILTTHRSRSASIASVGPSNAFVVLNYGAAQGALPAQQLLIRHGTDVVARVLISDVREHHSIAQVRPDSLRGALHKGDLAVLTD